MILAYKKKLASLSTRIVLCRRMLFSHFMVDPVVNIHQLKPRQRDITHPKQLLLNVLRRPHPQFAYPVPRIPPHPLLRLLPLALQERVAALR